MTKLTVHSIACPRGRLFLIRHCLIATSHQDSEMDLIAAPLFVSCVLIAWKSRDGARYIRFFCFTVQFESLQTVH